MKSINVLGAGFSGLSTAYYLVEAGFRVEIFEKGSDVGGLLQTERSSLGLVEAAANAFIATDKIVEISQTIGVPLEASLKSSRRRYIYRDGRPRRWPLGFWDSLKMLFRFVFCRRRRPENNESVKTWGERVLGTAPTSYLLSPALQGIYASVAEDLSASLILSRFFNPKVRRKHKTYRGSIAPRSGMHAFTVGLRDYLRSKGVIFHFDVAAIPLNSPTVIATSAPEAAKILATLAPQISAELAQVRMTPLTTVTVFFPPEAGTLKGFGCLFPRSEGFEVMGILMNGYIFAGRVHGSHSENWIFRGVAKTDEELKALITSERKKLYHRDDKILSMKITRWPVAIPCYDLEHEARLSRIALKDLEERQIYLSGNYLGSLGLSQILERNFELVERIKAK